MPLLAAHAVVRGGPRLLGAALLRPGWRRTPLSERRPRLPRRDGLLRGRSRLRSPPFRGPDSPHRPPHVRGPSVWLGGAYVLALVVTVTLLWPDLPAGLRIPVAGYSPPLTAMAAGKHPARARRGRGRGALAVRHPHRHRRRRLATAPEAWIFLIDADLMPPPSSCWSAECRSLGAQHPRRAAHRRDALNHPAAHSHPSPIGREGLLVDAPPPSTPRTTCAWRTSPTPGTTAHRRGRAGRRGPASAAATCGPTGARRHGRRGSGSGTSSSASSRRPAPR